MNSGWMLSLLIQCHVEHCYLLIFMKLGYIPKGCHIRSKEPRVFHYFSRDFQLAHEVWPIHLYFKQYSRLCVFSYPHWHFNCWISNVFSLNCEIHIIILFSTFFIVNEDKSQLSITLYFFRNLLCFTNFFRLNVLWLSFNSI